MPLTPPAPNTPCPPHPLPLTPPAPPQVTIILLTYRRAGLLQGHLPVYLSAPTTPYVATTTTVTATIKYLPMQ